MESILSATNSLVTNYSYVSGEVCTAPRDCIQSGLQHWMPPIDSYFKINVDGAFVHRSGNSVAHELAQFALKFKISDWWWSSDPPSCIVNLLSADLASV
ncbi:hypothetical protein BVC80_1649g16 [Macleaya cordata]|uniref:RNase H type-1 domain-containing protein n=1 Tax=Macleaya cordata TaxID=56857 RepID=A0A200PSQ8_MACCD|nr:hypothetical protein BVC80_1649g16 [Macleaya cordata]